MQLASSGNVPFRHWVFDDYWQPLNEIRMADAMLHQWEVFYDNELERGKKTSRQWNLMLPELKTAFIKLRHPDTVEELANLTGIYDLMDDPVAHGAGLHLSGDNSYLQTHCDYELHPTMAGKERRLNAILFMHHEWKKEWGGELLLCDMSGNSIVEIEPKPGRLALFECGPASMHGVRVITSKQAARLSCAVYYLADQRSTACRTRALFIPNRNSSGVPKEVSASQVK